MLRRNFVFRRPLLYNKRILFVLNSITVKILILGSGQVGSTVAQNLASLSSNDVTIVDVDEKALQQLSSKLDVQTIIGNGASPSVLERAAAADADLLLALTRSDETNIVACKIAADIFNVPNRIARVRSSEYLEYSFPNKEGEDSNSLNIFDITETISPEQLVTEQLVGLLSYSSTLQVLNFADNKVQMVIVQARQGGLLVGKEIADINAHLPEGIDCQICAIYRNNRLIVPSSKTVIIEGDEVFFVANIDNIDAIIRELRPKEQRSRRIMIAGGGNIGYRLAKKLENKYDIKIIEYNATRAEWLAENLDNTLVLHGSANDESLLNEEYIDEIDIYCALTNDDENNIMSSLLAKNLGAKRVIAIVNRSSYVDLLEGNKIDIVVSPHLTTIGSILAHIRRGDVVAVHPLRRGTAEAIEVIVHGDENTSAIVGRKISDVNWPTGCHFAALVRGEEVIMGHHTDEILQEGDHVIFFVSRRRVLRELEKLIQVKMGFFG